MNGEGLSGITSLIKGLNLNKIVGTANKTLKFVKQAVPVYKQVQPMFGNFKHFLNMYNSVKGEDKKTETNVDEIKESRPIKTAEHINRSYNDRGNAPKKLNDTLTFFQ